MGADDGVVSPLEPYLSHFRTANAQATGLLEAIRRIRLQHAVHQLGVVVVELPHLPQAASLSMDMAVELFIKLGEDFPELMYEYFYGQPTSLHWANQILRAIDDPRETESPDFTLMAGHLNSLLAAMAIRAQMAFDLPVPVRNGALVLPTLGLVTIMEADEPDRLVRLSSDGVALDLAEADHHVRLASSLTSEPPWLSFIRLQDPASGYEVVLDDLDQYRNVHPPAEWARITNAGHWQALFAEACQILAACDPVGFERVKRLLISLTPIEPVNEGDERSSTIDDCPGGMALTEPPDAVTLARLMLHETEHGLLNELLRVYPPNESRATMFAPWRDDPRPTLGVLHGVLAFAVQISFWHGLLEHGPARYHASAAADLARWYEPTINTATELLARGHLGPAWTVFIQATITTLQSIEITASPAVQAAANDVNLCNETMWQLRNRRFMPADIEAAVSAYLAEQNPTVLRFVLEAEAVKPEERAQSLFLVGLLERAAQIESTGYGLEPIPADDCFARGEYDNALALYCQGIYLDPTERTAWIGLLLSARRSQDQAWTRRARILEQHLPEMFCLMNTLRKQGHRPGLDALISWFGKVVT